MSKLMWVSLLRYILERLCISVMVFFGWDILEALIDGQSSVSGTKLILKLVLTAAVIAAMSFYRMYKVTLGHLVYLTEEIDNVMEAWDNLTETKSPDKSILLVSSEDRNFYLGDVVKHFKYELNSEEEVSSRQYLYQLTGVAENTQTGQDMIHYQALYEPYKEYTRPVEEFLSEVDHAKYPNISQKYRFELYTLR